MQVFSDNDKLSALVAAGADADGLALLTDVDAVFTKPPDQPGAERIKVYDRWEIRPRNEAQMCLHDMIKGSISCGVEAHSDGWEV